MKFYIVNEFDCPYPPLVAYETVDGKLNYLDRTKNSYDGMSKDRATPLEDFGFEMEYHQTEILFRKVRPSTATYHDGSLRLWQGDELFFMPYNMIKDAA